MAFSDYISPSPNNEWKRNLLILSIAQFLTMVGMNAIIPFLSLYVIELGITNPEEAKTWSGFIYGGLYLTAVIMIPIWGALGDRHGRKAMAIRALMGLALTVFLMSFANNVWQLFFLRMLQGALSGFIPAALAFVSADVPENRSGYAIGILSSAMAAGNIVGPFMGGVIADTLGIRPVFYIVAILCFLAGLTIIFWLKERNFTPSVEKYNIFDNLKYVFSNKLLILLMALIVLAQTGIQFTLPIFTFFVEKLGAPKDYLATITGLMFVVIGVFSIIFAPVWGKRNDLKDWRKTLKVSSAVSGVLVIVHIFVPHYLYLYPIRAVIGVFYAAITPTLYSALSKRVPTQRKGGMMGLASASNLLGSMFGLTFSGMIASNFGIDSTFIISGVLLLFVVLLASYKVK